MIYHHAVTEAAAQAHVRDLLAQADADRLAERATTSRRRRHHDHPSPGHAQIFTADGRQVSLDSCGPAGPPPDRREPRRWRRLANGILALVDGGIAIEPGPVHREGTIAVGPTDHAG